MKATCFVCHENKRGYRKIDWTIGGAYAKFFWQYLCRKCLNYEMKLANLRKTSKHYDVISSPIWF